MTDHIKEGAVGVKFRLRNGFRRGGNGGRGGGDRSGFVDGEERALFRLAESQVRVAGDRRQIGVETERGDDARFLQRRGQVDRTSNRKFGEAEIDERFFRFGAAFAELSGR